MENTLITCLLIFTFILFNTRCCNSNSTLLCKPSERRALLNFKLNVTYVDPDFSSTWEGDECCEWTGVVCDNTTGHIIQLYLSGDNTKHEASSIFKMEKLESLVYLLELRQLETLDLSNNNFTYRSIPRFIGSMKQLRYLYLSSASLGGLVPYELGNLTNLESLDLSYNMLSGEIPASLGKLSSLKKLYLSFNNLSSIASSLRFPSNLESLDLSHNHLSGKIATSLGKLSKLQTLDISSNLLNDIVLSEPDFTNLSSLEYLEMGNTMLTLNLSSDWTPPFQLVYLSASNCKINGQLPPWLQTQKNLSSLFLSGANIFGLMPSWFHSMQLLEAVDLSNNNLSGSPIFPINFSVIYLSNNSFASLLFSNSSTSEKYHKASEIYLENNFIEGPLPEYLGNLMPRIEILVIANNQIKGSIPNSLCQATSLMILNMQNNNLTGEIPNCWGHFHIIPRLTSLSLSNNQIKGPIPDSLCHMRTLGFLDLQNNSLSGEIPNCWATAPYLRFVRLSYNNLKGRIPCFISVGNTVQVHIVDKNITTTQDEVINTGFYLHLNDNMLTGEIPSCFSDLANLKVLDIGGNQLSGKIHRLFTAQNMTNMQILRLRGNKFSGTIPRQICSLPQLQIMDLSYNHFTGSIPLCLNNLTSMITPNTLWDNIPLSNISEAMQGILIDRDNIRFSDISVVMQGIERAYTSALPYLVDIDLSCNNLIGSIPDNMTKITGLLNLNLSYNQLSGMIPENIGGLKSLISLDLSMNELRGRIPISIGEIPRLSHLNLSYNNLSGQIPNGNQLQVLSDQASIYGGNPYLCADFLPKKCKADKQDNDTITIGVSRGNNKEKLKKMGFYLVVMSGFATGFWGVVGCLVLNRRWRYAFFQRLEDAYNWLYVIVVLKLRAAKAKINNR